MMPPVCEICNKEFNPDHEGGLVYFRKSEKIEEFDRRAKERGFTGHPPDTAWFCGEHYEEAKKLTHLVLGEAMGKLKAHFKT